MFFWGKAKINGNPVVQGDTIIAIIPNDETHGGCVGGGCGWISQEMALYGFQVVNNRFSL